VQVGSRDGDAALIRLYSQQWLGTGAHTQPEQRDRNEARGCRPAARGAKTLFLALVSTRRRDRGRRWAFWERKKVTMETKKKRNF